MPTYTTDYNGQTYSGARPGVSVKNAAQAAMAAGATLPEGQKWTMDPAGALTTKDESFFDRNWKWLGPAIAGGAVAAPFIGGALGGGGGAAASGATGSAIPSTALPLSTSLPMAVTGAPSTGGILGSIFGAGTTGGKIMDVLGKVGPVAASAAKGSAEGRIQESLLNNQRDQLEQNRAIGNANIDTTRLRELILLSLLGGAQDSQITPPEHIASHMPTMTGGLRPSALQGKDEIIAAMRPRLLAALLSGEHLPATTDAPDASFLDKLLSGVGLVGGLYGSLQKAPTAPSAPSRVPTGNPQVARNAGVRF